VAVLLIVCDIFYTELEIAIFALCILSVDPSAGMPINITLIYTLLKSAFSGLQLGVPLWQSHRRSGLVNLPSVGAVP